MDDTSHAPPARPEIRVPAETFRTLARAARGGDEAVGRALLEAGRRAGSSICAAVDRGGDPRSESMASFWATVREALSERGLGTASYHLLSPGIAEVLLEDGPEASEAVGTGSRAGGCPFATGLLAGLLSEAAGEPVAVLEVACRSRGESACRFLAGDEGRLRRVRREMHGGSSVEEAVGTV